MKYPLIVLVALLGAPAALAERIQIPIGAQGSAATAESLPARGATTVDVENRWGPPAEKHPPVGEPPIERWDYADFSVYFETGHVVHSVLRHKPLVPAN